MTTGRIDQVTTSSTALSLLSEFVPSRLIRLIRTLRAFRRRAVSFRYRLSTFLRQSARLRFQQNTYSRNRTPTETPCIPDLTRFRRALSVREARGLPEGQETEITTFGGDFSWTSNSSKDALRSPDRSPTR